MSISSYIADAAIQSYDNVTISVGGTSLNEDLRVKINDLARKHNGRFQFLGYVPREKTIELTQKAHLGFYFMKPDTRYWVKSSPNKIFEYLVCGTVPIVRANVDHADRLRECSLIFNREDENEVIMQAVLDLLDSPERLKYYMSNARELSLDYTWESVACRYIELYSTLLRPEAAPSRPNPLPDISNIRDYGYRSLFLHQDTLKERTGNETYTSTDVGFRLQFTPESNKLRAPRLSQTCTTLARKGAGPSTVIHQGTVRAVYPECRSDGRG